MVVIKKILLCSLSILNLSCHKTYKYTNEQKGEIIIDLDSYTLPSTFVTSKTISIIDTTALYLQLFDKDANNSERENPEILKFHSDGFFENRSKKYYHEFEGRKKNSLYYGGKYIIYGNNEIKIEKFYPSKQGKTNQYIKEISNGIIKGDTIVLNIFNIEKKFIKTTFDEIFR